MTKAQFSDWLDRQAGTVFIGPAVTVILLFSIFPLLASAWLSLTRFSLQSGGYELSFVGALNYRKLIAGSQQFHLLGTAGEMSAGTWTGLILAFVLLAWAVLRSLRRRAGFADAAQPAPHAAAAALALACALVAVMLAPLGPFASAAQAMRDAADWPWFAWLLLGFVLFIAAAVTARLLGARAGLSGLVGRQLAGSVWLLVALTAAGTANGQQGSLLTTLFYVAGGVALQFVLGLGLALLCAQPIRGRTLFRLSFFLPLMVTPVGIAYMFRMLADMSVGPFAPIARVLGLGAMTWAQNAWSARWVVLIGDTWQWVPFIFIVLLAAIEGQPRDQLEAAQLDGAPSWRIFRDITWPAIAPTAAAVVLIRVIEAFKIVDLPNVLTNGGPGIATESMTLHAFIDWRSLNLGGSAAVAYLLLFVSTLMAVSFFHFVVRPARGEQAA
ncbi:carbohydrate ABC transporter permease [Rhizobacter sp. OV335]|uniref:carbohydrate ABC transporter permease n=1 Tax=Rhizobacter sp. OV335 TaxID=1500264 RepID=UPI0009115890|nr:sugar ABC transporter permease [Rhizobacter sp. OV335]SHN01631.1 ABC-type sugar transport system, permease component [Rhizobacter sp. OV335]